MSAGSNILRCAMYAHINRNVLEKKRKTKNQQLKLYFTDLQVLDKLFI